MAERRKLIVYGGASLREETRKLLCAEERDGGNKQIIVCGGA